MLRKKEGIINKTINTLFAVSKSKTDGITLIALVITIIVLLILAGVTINLTLGNNGIFKTAEQAAKNYTEAQNKELANLNEFENIVDKVTQAPEYNPSLLKLKPGDYVKYDTGVKEVGDNGIATFRVLYDATSEYGLQIISDKGIADVTLGGSDWETGKESHNKAIELLNDEAMKYKNDIYATDARCVGSNPANKNSENKENAILKFIPTDWTTKDSGCKDFDMNYEIDKEAMSKTQIWDIQTTYWLASRRTDLYDDGAYFCVRRVKPGGSMSMSSWCYIQYDNLYGGSNSHALRPCITLKPDITITSGDGASEATAYTLGI